MNLTDVNKIELELTSRCNAACPGCARTLNPGKFPIADLTIADIKRLFPVEYIKDKKFKLCGVLGDPVFNDDCLEITEYIVRNGGYCQISTNAGIQTAGWWRKLGALSAETGLVDVAFCIDGHAETNHIYRVNTYFPTILRNLESYYQGGAGQALGTWVYIVFDHNEHEVDAARETAQRLNLKFALRTGMRNSMSNWVAEVKTKKSDHVVREQRTITTTGEKEHSKKQQVQQIESVVTQYQQSVVNSTPVSSEVRQLVAETVSTITCKLVHEGEIFIASNLTVWPCCFLWDSYFKNKDSIVDKLSDFDSDWNSVATKSIADVIGHRWFSNELGESWNFDHPRHLTRCVKTCAHNKAYHNEVKIIDQHGKTTEISQ